MQDRRELFEESGLAKKPSCSLQDAASLVPAARPRQRNALGPKPSCSLQDFAGGAAGLAGAGPAGCAPRTQGGSAGTGGDSQHGGPAISAGCPGRLGGTRDRFQSCGGDNPSAGVADTPGAHKQSGQGENGKAGTVAGSSGSGRSSDGSESGCKPSIVTALFRGVLNAHAKAGARWNLTASPSPANLPESAARRAVA